MIDEHKGKLGVFSFSEAVKMAEEAGKDLIQLSSSPTVVCKIMDYGKFKYNEEKKAKEQKKKKRIEEMKEIRLRPHIAAHDLEVKINAIRKILGEGRKVRIVIKFLGRERGYLKPGEEIFETIKRDVADIGKFAEEPKMDGGLMKAIVLPNK